VDASVFDHIEPRSVMPQCTKQSYRNRYEANRALLTIREANLASGKTAPTRAYRCRTCWALHLTSQKSFRITGPAPKSRAKNGCG